MANDKQRIEAALDLLLSIWRGTRSDEVADLIERLGRRVARRPLGGSTLKAMTARWMEIAEARDAHDLPRLVAALANGRAATAATRLAVLLEFPEDPRVVRELETFLAVPPYASGTAMDRSTALARQYLERCATGARPLTDEERRVVVELSSLAGSKSGDELLAAIYANPRDDGPREVYADWLLEQGDPRGELLVLQLRGGDPDREAALIKQCETKLLGPIAKVTTRRRYARGFLVACALKSKNSRSLITASTANQWLTVEELHDVGNAIGPADLVLQPAFRNLRRVYGINAMIFEALLAAPSLPAFEALGMAHVGLDRIPELAKISTLRSLTIESHVALTSARAVASLPLDRLEVGIEITQLGEWLRTVAVDEFATRGYGLTTVSRRIDDRWDVTLSGTAVGDYERAVVSLTGVDTRSIELDCTPAMREVIEPMVRGLVASPGVVIR
ncbi:MAG: TIGR02996 domain-containing protein [Proteobacteria bacterium]|nr:TIGR02996 domain-containing protein [Pseudomonadota bacterium]